jgi:hypothetical protein
VEMVRHQISEIKEKFNKNQGQKRYQSSISKKNIYPLSQALNLNNQRQMI